MPNQFHLSRSKMLEYLGSFPAGENALTFYIPPGLPPDKLADIVKRVPAAIEIQKQITEICTGSANGAAIYWSSQTKSLIIPPFPIRDTVILEGMEIEHLKSMLGREYTIGIVLIRLGSYGVGIARGDKLVSSKVGTGLVHARHRQGGSSSHRFERHRDKQMETFFNRVCGHVQEIFTPYVKSIDYLVYGGAWETVQLFIKYCPMLSKLNKPVLPALSDTPEPRQSVLEKAVGRFLSGTVYDFS